MTGGATDSLGRLAQYVLVVRITAAVLALVGVLLRPAPQPVLLVLLPIVVACNYLALRHWSELVARLRIADKPLYLLLDGTLAWAMLTVVGIGSPLVLYLVATGLLAGLVHRGRQAVPCTLALAGGYLLVLVLGSGYLPGTLGVHTVLTLPALLLGSAPAGVAVKRLLLAQQRAAREVADLHEQGAVQEERLRLARDLHDSVTKNLYGIGLLAHGLQAALDRGEHGSARATSALIGRTASGLAAQARDVIHDLREPEPDLPAALTALVERVGEEHALTIDLRVLDPPAVAGPARHEVLAVAGEALHNAVKHAHAERVEVRLEGGADGLRLVVADDGVGLDGPRTAEQGHYGLVGMQERAARAGGRLEVSSERGTGTRVQLELPVVRAGPGDQAVQGKRVERGEVVAAWSRPRAV
jgi:signal transduction histidine kinase